jgi:hypothetical protein
LLTDKFVEVTDKATMTESMQRSTVLILSLLLGILILFTSLNGFMSPDFYKAESSNWQAQAIGQDLINVFIILLFLLISAYYVYKGSSNALLLWAGTILYIIYTYVIYCFTIHFNEFFLQYCFILGTSIYILLYIFYSKSNLCSSNKSKRRISKITALYFLILALLFCFLWLSEVLPAVLAHSVPKTIKDAGLFTNPVHVLDLSVLLPGIFITGILLLKQKRIAWFLAPLILTFLFLMDITIAVLTLVMADKGFSNDVSVAYVMSVLALISAVLLSLNLKNNKQL